jgi:hypothetical protein
MIGSSKEATSRYGTARLAAITVALSAVGSFTAGIDAYDTGNTGRVTLEEGYLGYRTNFGNDLNFDVSLGPR